MGPGWSTSWSGRPAGTSCSTCSRSPAPPRSSTATTCPRPATARRPSGGSWTTGGCCRASPWACRSRCSAWTWTGRAGRSSSPSPAGPTTSGRHRLRAARRPPPAGAVPRRLLAGGLVARRPAHATRPGLRGGRAAGSLRDRTGGGAMAGDGRAGAAGGYDFDLATAVRGGPERWTAEVDPGWTVAGRPDGGYLLALATRAALEAAGQPHPLAVSAHFLAPSEPGPAELEVRRLRAGRSLSTVRVTLVQEGAARLEALVTAGRIDPDADPGWRRATGP